MVFCSNWMLDKQIYLHVPQVTLTIMNPVYGKLLTTTYSAHNYTYECALFQAT